MAEAARILVLNSNQRRLQPETRCQQMEISAELEKALNSEMHTEAIILASKAQQEAQARVDEVPRRAEQQLEQAEVAWTAAARTNMSGS